MNTLHIKKTQIVDQKNGGFDSYQLLIGFVAKKSSLSKIL